MQTDLVNITRGRAVVGYDPAHRPLPSVGWVPADLALDAFGGLVENPWGAVGDLRLVADPETFVEIDAGSAQRPALRLVLANCTESDGSPWDACPRGVLHRAVDRLAEEFGLRLLAAFEHEFAIIGSEVPHPFSLEAGRRAEPLLSNLVSALSAAGLEPENILAEFGHNQFEVTIEPATGLAAADRAVVAREAIREVARAEGVEITLSPVIGVGAGTNGAHIHLSLLDIGGRSVTEDAGGAFGLSDRARSFAAGIMQHLPALTALSAPSVASYLRLQPRSWSAAYQAFGVCNREAALRIAPGRPEGGGRQRLGPSLELRTSDATANPYLALAGIITAGIDGLNRQLDLGSPTDIDPSELTPEQRAARGIEPLPRSLDEALDALEGDALIRSVFSPNLDSCWFALKRSEADRFRSIETSEIVEAYANAY